MSACICLSYHAQSVHEVDRDDIKAGDRLYFANGFNLNEAVWIRSFRVVEVVRKRSELVVNWKYCVTHLTKDYCSEPHELRFHAYGSCWVGALYRSPKALLQASLEYASKQSNTLPHDKLPPQVLVKKYLRRLRTATTWCDTPKEDRFLRMPKGWLLEGQRFK